MHSAGLELTKLTYTRLEDNLIRHRGDRSQGMLVVVYFIGHFPGISSMPKFLTTKFKWWRLLLAWIST